MTIPVNNPKQISVNAELLSLGSKVSYAVGNGDLINDQFQIVNKGGFKWVVLSILHAIARPFYALFGKDPYSYVRVDNVARNVLKYCELNKQHLEFQSEDSVIFSLDHLNTKTKGKYNATITDVKSKIHQLYADTLKVKKAEADANAKEAAAKAEAEAKAKEAAAAEAAESVAKAKELTEKALYLEQKINDLKAESDANAKEAAAKAEAEKKAQQEKAFEENLIAQQEALIKKFAEQKAQVDKQNPESMTLVQMISIQVTMNQLQKVSDEQAKTHSLQIETINKLASTMKPQPVDLSPKTQNAEADIKAKEAAEKAEAEKKVKEVDILMQKKDHIQQKINACKANYLAQAHIENPNTLTIEEKALEYLKLQQNSIEKVKLETQLQGVVQELTIAETKAKEAAEKAEAEKKAKEDAILMQKKDHIQQKINAFKANYQAIMAKEAVAAQDLFGSYSPLPRPDQLKIPTPAESLFGTLYSNQPRLDNPKTLLIEELALEYLELQHQSIIRDTEIYIHSTSLHPSNLLMYQSKLHQLNMQKAQENLVLIQKYGILKALADEIKSSPSKPAPVIDIPV